MSETLTLVNPWQRKRQGPVTETVPLPGLGAEITLQSLDRLPTFAALDEADDLIAEFVGGEESEAEPKLFLAPNGEEYQLNARLIRDLCLLRQMQVAERRYEFPWWLGVALCCDEEYRLLEAAAQRVNAKAQKRTAGNSPAPTGSTSG